MSTDPVTDYFTKRIRQRRREQAKVWVAVLLVYGAIFVIAFLAADALARGVLYLNQ